MENLPLHDLLDPALLAGLEAMPMDDVRALRRDCERHEASLSYSRRLVQGRLDIVRSEAKRRLEGRSSGDVQALIDALPDILSDGADTGPAPESRTMRRPIRSIGSTDADPEVLAQLHGLAGPDTLAALDEVDDGTLASLENQLGEIERQVSTRRRSLHEHLDALHTEITRRYASGEVALESLLS